MRMWRLGSGHLVVDRPGHSHVQDHAAVLPLLDKALSEVVAQPEDDIIVREIEFDRVVGASQCVATTEADDVFFHKRTGRKGPTRFVHNRKPEPTRFVTVVLKRNKTMTEVFVLSTAYVGKTAPPEPWSHLATVISVEFWRTHALVWLDE